jgi:hypothetical protein
MSLSGQDALVWLIMQRLVDVISEEATKRKRPGRSNYPEVLRGKIPTPTQLVMQFDNPNKAFKHGSPDQAYRSINGMAEDDMPHCPLALRPRRNHI